MRKKCEWCSQVHALFLISNTGAANERLLFLTLPKKLFCLVFNVSASLNLSVHHIHQASTLHHGNLVYMIMMVYI